MNTVKPEQRSNPIPITKINNLKRKSKDEMTEAERARFKQRIEQQIIDSICPTSNINEVNTFVYKVESITSRVLDAKPNSKNEETTRFIPVYKCPSCGNNNQNGFVIDNRHGQVTCKECGIVAQDHKIHDGEWKRQFEGDVNPSFHGPLPDPRFSSGHNLRTAIAPALQLPGSSDIQAKGKDLRDLKFAQNYIELNLSNMGSDARRTREGYKDKMKQEAFRAMDDVVSNLQLHDNVKTKAQKMFAVYRDELEQLQKLNVVKAACLISAFREMLSAGGQTHAKVGSKKAKTETSKVVKNVGYEDLHPFVCKYCGARFNMRKPMRMHMSQCDKRPKGDGKK